MAMFFYAPEGYKCLCAKVAHYVAVDDETETAEFFCGDCLRDDRGQEPEIKTARWLGACPPYMPVPAQIRILEVR